MIYDGAKTQWKQIQEGIGISNAWNLLYDLRYTQKST